MSEQFSVWQWFEGNWHECVGQGLDAENAVKLAHSYTIRPAAQMGIIRRVTIVAIDDDSTRFEWQWGEGVTYPPRGPDGRFIADDGSEMPP